MGWTHQPCKKGSALIISYHEMNTSPCKKGSALISYHGMNTSTMSEGLNTYILPWDEHINHVIRDQNLYLTMVWTHQPCNKGSTLISDHGMNTSTMSEGLCTYIWSCGMNTSLSHIRMALHLYLTMKWTHQPCQKGSRTHHFPLEGTSIWRTPSFSLKYSNFTLANGLVNTSASCSSIATY